MTMHAFHPISDVQKNRVVNRIDINLTSMICNGDGLFLRVNDAGIAIAAVPNDAYCVFNCGSEGNTLEIFIGFF